MKKLLTAIAVLVAGTIYADSLTILYTANNPDGSVAMSRAVNNFTFTPLTNAWTSQRMIVTSATNHVVIGSDVVIAGYAFSSCVGTAGVYMAVSGSPAFAYFPTNYAGVFPLASTNLDVWTDVGKTSIFEFWLKHR